MTERRQLDLAAIGGFVIVGAIGSLMTFGALALARPSLLAGARAQAVFEHPQPIGRVDGVFRSLRVQRGSDLSFRLIARINHVPVVMLVDTGANITVLTKEDARRVGLATGATTDGHIDVVGIDDEATRFRRVGSYPIGLGPIGLASVPIAIDDSGRMRNSILGQDAICGIDRVTIQHDEIEFLHSRQVAQGCSDDLPTVRTVERR